MLRKPTEYKGCQIHHIFESPDVVASGPYSEDYKTELKGTLAVEHLKNSYKYGEEGQIVVYSKEMNITSRVPDHNGYYRIEIRVPLSVLYQAAQKILKHCWTVSDT